MWAVYAFFFLRFTDLHLIISAKTGFNNYLLYIAALPALIGLLLSGGLRRAFRLRSSWYLAGFMVLVTFSAVFSTWMGGSIPLAWTYFRTSWICFLLLAGLIMTWKELWGMLQVISLGAAVDVLIAVFMRADFDKSGAGRYGVELGTYSNPNDFAAVLILVLPFLALVLFTPKRNMLLRLATLPFLLVGFYKVLATGSRGALVGTAIASLYLIAKIPVRLKVLAVMGVLAIGLITFIALPNETIERLSSWKGGSSNFARESEQSTESRILLLQKSLIYTVQHPIFGVGPGEFADYEGRQSMAKPDKKACGMGPTIRTLKYPVKTGYLR